ncbi:MAG: hypothetical protein AB1765_00685 [Candidatus Hydrogenedentota bacterium]
MKTTSLSFLFILFLVILIPSSLSITDELVYFEMGKNIITIGKPCLIKNNNIIYPRFQGFYPLLLTPYILCAKYLGKIFYFVFNEQTSNMLNWALIPLFNGIITLVIFYLIRLFINSSYNMSFIFVTSCILLFYSKTLFIEPVLSLFMFLSVMFLYKQRYLLSSMFIAFLVILKPVNIIYTPVFYIFFLLKNRNLLKNIEFLAISILLPVILHFAYNSFYRGDFYNFGYQPRYYDTLTKVWVHQGFSHSILRGLAGYLFSPGKSFFIYNPLLLLALAGIIKGIIEKQILAVMIFILFLQTIFLYAGWAPWEGGLCYGPRFLLIIVPILSAGFIYLKDITYKKIFKILFVGLSSIGFIINFTASITNVYNAYLKSGRYGTGHSFSMTYNYLYDIFKELVYTIADPSISPNLILKLFPDAGLFLLLLFTGFLIFSIVLFDWNRSVRGDYTAPSAGRQGI